MSALTRPGSTKAQVSPHTAALLAVGCGTAASSVCAVGLFHIEGLLGGVWSVAAVLTAGLVCLMLARALGRLAEVVPSGAGLLAYLARGLGRSIGLLLVVPYVLLTLLLAGAEAVIVGLLLSRLVPVPVPVGALLFLIVTWLLCRRGVRVSYRVQAAATWALVAGLGVVSLAAIYQAAQRGELLTRLVPAAPNVGHFAAGVGQALFLFMGFELVTSQAEIAATPRSIDRALTGSVGVLAGFYSLVSLGFSCLPERLPGGSAALVPQLDLADQAGGGWVVVLIAGLSLLASFTSFHGALLALSRFTSALPAQGMLPRRFARIEPRTLMPRSALALLLALTLAATALVWFGEALRPSILAAAFAVAVVYAASA
ncbi:MAG TPA: APC family permease [Gemmataceae bacterium]|jgi:amino acid transporter